MKILIKAEKQQMELQNNKKAHKIQQHVYRSYSEVLALASITLVKDLLLVQPHHCKLMNLFKLSQKFFKNSLW